MAAKRRKKASAKRPEKMTKAWCDDHDGRFVKFRGRNNPVCFLHDKATAATKKKRLASLRKARAKSPIGKKSRRRSRKK